MENPVDNIKRQTVLLEELLREQRATNELLRVSRQQSLTQVKDFDMPLGSMIRFSFKAFIANILILAILALFSGLITGVFGLIAAVLSHR